MFKLKYWCKLWPTDTCNVNKFRHKDKFINLLGTSRWYYIEIQILFNQPFTQIICAYSTSGSNVITRYGKTTSNTITVFKGSNASE